MHTHRRVFALFLVLGFPACSSSDLTQANVGSPSNPNPSTGSDAGTVDSASSDAAHDLGDAAAPPVDITASGPGPNEPSGFTAISSNPFDALPPDHPTVDSYGYTKFYGTTNLSIVSDSTAPASPSNLVRLLFPAGFGGGSAPNAFVAGQGFSVGGNKTRLYTRLHFRISASWSDNGNTGTKFFFIDQTQGNNHYVDLTSGGSLQLGVNLQSDFGYATPSGANHFGPTLTKGVWHDAELLFVANTPGTYNGVARIWVDGTKVLDATDIGYFASGQTAYWDQFWFAPTYGGGLNSVPADQNVDIDHWYTSVAP